MKSIIFSVIIVVGVFYVIAIIPSVFAFVDFVSLAEIGEAQCLKSGCVYDGIEKSRLIADGLSPDISLAEYQSIYKL